MALNAYLTLKGQKQGNIEGSVTQKGREKKIMVIASNHEVVSPRDVASGLPTGKRQHKPFVITKELDKSTPLLQNALVNNENITEWELQYWAAGEARTGGGNEVQDYTIKLLNANIAGIREEQLNNQFPDNARHAAREHVSFTYQKITWTWVKGGISAEDDWETPVV